MVLMAAAYYDPNAALIQVGKKGTFGREAIKNEFVEYVQQIGKSTSKGTVNSYQMTGDFIIITGDHESITEKMGTIKGKYTQIWRKSGDTYLILHEEYVTE
ncbi:hypothetical protein ANCCEY_08367 [Ancylostoma ceylanicum]|uniref:DUF4440 domain-containing protein n=1 Tax=Ancylostoma ceylanicum TaxID=53326 RepID=A0A0D6LR81_9BILA|nr:hypothetical protein ANCCEY_08367 [Ancylostoma ceylanicum]